MRMDSNEPIYFECGQCGDCCSSWNIPIEGDKARILMQKPWVQERLTHVRRSFVRMSYDLYRIPLSDENVCVFLSEDRRCLVQANEGPALKPLECRRFPFAAIRLPEPIAAGQLSAQSTTSTERIRYETSAACKKISESLLLAFRPVVPTPATYQAALLSESLPQANEAIAESLGKSSFYPAEPASALSPYLDYHETFEVLDVLPECLPVGLFQKKISRAGYEAWCVHLRSVFTNPAITPEASLREAARSLKQLARNPQQALLIPLDFAWGQFSSHASHWLLLMLLRKPYRTWSLVQLLRGRRYDDPRLFGTSVDLRMPSRFSTSVWTSRENASDQKASIEEDRPEHLLKAFLFNLLCRRLPLARGISVTGWIAVAVCACLLVRWYAIMLAGLRMSAEELQTFRTEALRPETGDVSLAIRLVERYYTGHQPRFLQSLHAGWKSALIYYFFLR
jgi:Fe-S-cluster containining protein